LEITISAEDGVVSLFIAFFFHPIQQETHHQSWSRLPAVAPELHLQQQQSIPGDHTGRRQTKGR